MTMQSVHDHCGSRQLLGDGVGVAMAGDGGGGGGGSFSSSGWIGFLPS